MKLFYFICVLIGISLARTYNDDSAVVRTILDLNGKENVYVDSVSDSANGRITGLGLIDIDTIPGEITELDSLKMLGLYQRFSLHRPKLSIPKDLWKMQSLEGLTIGNTYFDIPPEISGLINLKALSFFQSHVDSISPELWNLPNLESLFMYSLPIDSFPAPFGTLTKLKSLFIRYLKRPPVFTLPLSLENIYLEQSGYVPLPSEIFTCINLKSLQIRLFESDTLAVLNLNGFGIDTLPKEIGNLKELTSLFLENTNLAYLPGEISELNKLKGLYLARNRLKELPESIVSLSRVCFAVDYNFLCNLSTNIQQWIDSCSCTTGWRTTQDCPDLVKEIRLPVRNQEFKVLTNIKARTATFYLPRQVIELSIYDIFGRLIYSAVSPGSTVVWRGTNSAGRFVTFGAYVAKVSTRAGVLYKPFILPK